MDLFYMNEMGFVLGILSQNHKDRKMKEYKNDISKFDYYMIITQLQKYVFLKRK